MPSLPDAFVPLLAPFTSLFDAYTWRKARRLLIGSVLDRVDAPCAPVCGCWGGRPSPTLPCTTRS